MRLRVEYSEYCISSRKVTRLTLYMANEEARVKLHGLH
jgi:hypothetical protein